MGKKVYVKILQIMILRLAAFWARHACYMPYEKRQAQLCVLYTITYTRNKVTT